MTKNIRVLVLEDDPYSRDFMEMLLMRDWRTRVVGSAGALGEFRKIIENSVGGIDLVLLDTEAPHHHEWLFQAVKLIQSLSNSCFILCTGTKPNLAALEEIVSLGGQGYVLKNEIGYGLAAAVKLAVSGKWVLTSLVEKLARDNDIALPKERIIIESQVDLHELTPREQEIARLAILFNLSYRDLHDELLIRADQVGKYVHRAYEKIELHDILAGISPLENYFESELILAKYRKAIEIQNKGKNPSNLSTMAFHLLTRVKIDKSNKS